MPWFSDQVLSKTEVADAMKRISDRIFTYKGKKFLRRFLGQKSRFLGQISEFDKNESFRKKSAFLTFFDLKIGAKVKILP